MAYIPSANITVYPSQHRTYSGDSGAKYNSELNITNITNGFCEGDGTFIESATLSSNTLTCVIHIHGYRFSISSLDVSDYTSSGLWAGIKIDSTTNTLKPLGTYLDESNNFTGLCIGASTDVSSCDYTLQILTTSGSTLSINNDAFYSSKLYLHNVSCSSRIQYKDPNAPSTTASRNLNFNIILYSKQNSEITTYSNLIKNLPLYTGTLPSPTSYSFYQPSLLSSKLMVGETQDFLLSTLILSSGTGIYKLECTGFEDSNDYLINQLYSWSDQEFTIIQDLITTIS